MVVPRWYVVTAADHERSKMGGCGSLLQRGASIPIIRDNYEVGAAAVL
jgi:hypothetical protein